MRKHLVIFSIIMALVFTSCTSKQEDSRVVSAGRPGGGGGGGDTVAPPLEGTPQEKAIHWLKFQQDLATTGLVDSMEDTLSISYTYDQAVAAIAFTLAGETTRAANVLNALKNLQNANGSWYTAYYTESLAVQESRQHLGPNMWVGMAVYHYEKATGDTQFNAMVDAMIQFSLGFQRADGGIDGGYTFDGSEEPWCSVEQNQDALVVLQAYGYTTAAQGVLDFLNASWDVSEQRYWTGRDDSRDMMDVNPWGIMSVGPHQNGMPYVEANHYTDLSLRSKGSTTIYPGFDFDSDNDDVWYEGMAFVAVAYEILGDTVRENEVITMIVNAQNDNGGVEYSQAGTDNTMWTMSDDPCISSTGWLVMALNDFNPFNLN